MGKRVKEMPGEDDNDVEKPVVKKLSSSSNAADSSSSSPKKADNDGNRKPVIKKLSASSSNPTSKNVDNGETLNSYEDDAEEVDFPKASDNQGDPTPSWGDGVPHKIWFRIRSYRWIDTPYGTTMLVVLEGEDGSLREVWSTPMIAQSIQMKSSTKESGKSVYIKTLELKESKKDPGRSYFNFVTKVQ